MFSFSRLSPLFAAGLCLFFGAALQVQITLFAGENYEGLRLNLADAALPFAGIFILVSLLAKKTVWPNWQRPFGYGWIIALSLVMVMGLVNGYLASGGWSQWALVNKFAGWFVLMAYLGAGAWIGSNYSDYKGGYFLKAFIGFAAFSIAAFLLYRLPEYYVFQSDIPRPFKALMGNPNAFGFLFCAVAAFATLFSFKAKNIPAFVPVVFWASLPFILLLSGSRTLWIAVTLLVVFFVTIDWRKSLRCILPFLLVSGLCAALIAQAQPSNVSQRVLVTSQELLNYAVDPESANEAVMRKSGHSERIEIIRISFGLWKERPVVGAGLGAVQERQVEEHGQLLSALDNTLLWLLSEMGLVGAGIFLAAFIAILLALWRKMKEAEKEENLFAFCALVMLLVFGLFSLFHEVLYTRFMWFILGLALAAPRTRPSLSKA